MYWYVLSDNLTEGKANRDKLIVQQDIAINSVLLFVFCFVYTKSLNERQNLNLLVGLTENW